jgi:hypothetical protein
MKYVLLAAVFLLEMVKEGRSLPTGPVNFVGGAIVV